MDACEFFRALGVGLDIVNDEVEIDGRELDDVGGIEAKDFPVFVCPFRNQSANGDVLPLINRIQAKEGPNVLVRPIFASGRPYAFDVAHNIVIEFAFYQFLEVVDILGGECEIVVRFDEFRKVDEVEGVIIFRSRFWTVK
jgi:hypothetical protein